MKKLALCTVVSLSFFSLSGASLASDRPDHFQGESSETLEAAVSNFSEYNKKLADVLAKDELAPADMVQVHELTYTLENALEKIRDELEDLADTLEEVHVASEKLDADEIREQGNSYLDTAGKIIP